MSIIILLLKSNFKNNHFSTLTDPQKTATYYEQVAVRSENKLLIIGRGDVGDKIQTNNITIILHQDDLPIQLSWWQEPEDLFRHIAEFNPDIIHVMGLDLPLHYRWLRKQVGKAPYILGQYTGEQIWPNIRIWMQQFGLRTANGFLFDDELAADLWLKRAAILPRQDLFKIKNLHRDPEFLAQVYLKILKSN